MSAEAVAAATAVGVVAPYLAAAGTEAAKALGKEAVEAGKKVLGWMKAKLTGPAAEALTELEQAPGDHLNAPVLEKQLGKALLAEPALLAELRQLLAEVKAEAVVTQTMNVTGDNNISGQLAGSGNAFTVRR